MKLRQKQLRGINGNLRVLYQMGLDSSEMAYLLSIRRKSEISRKWHR
jgi:hypothetical protein